MCDLIKSPDVMYVGSFAGGGVTVYYLADCIFNCL